VAYKAVIHACNNEKTAKKAVDLLAPFADINSDEFKNALLVTSMDLEVKAPEQKLQELLKNCKASGINITIEGISQITTHGRFEEDEEEDCPSNFQNLINSVTTRKDVFEIEKERKLIGATILSLLIGLACGIWFNGMDIIDFSPDFFERLPPERTAKLVVDIPKIEKEKEKEVKKKKEEREKTLEKKKEQPKPSGGGGGGGGDPRARVTRKGVLGIISGKVKGKSVVGREVLSQGFAKDIDDILNNIGGLKKGGEEDKSRKGLAGVGFGRGYGAGYGGGTGGIDDMIGGLFGSSEGINLKKKGTLVVEAPKTVSSGPMSGGRTKESIMRVVMQHIPGLRYAYNKRLKVKPGMKGKVTVRFKIAPEGNVAEATVVNSSMGDQSLEEDIVSQIMRWRFDPVEKGFDVVEYPFAFSQ
jgi:TonB family protein